VERFHGPAARSRTQLREQIASGRDREPPHGSHSLKDAGETEYPAGRFEQAVRGCPFAVMTNAPFSRPLLALTKAAGANVVTDLQTYTCRIPSKPPASNYR
jgi:hypothetical protein